MDFVATMIVEKYGKERDPNKHALQAPIDIYDAARIIVRQDAEIERLKKELGEGEAVRPNSIPDELRQAVANADMSFIDTALKSKEPKVMETALERVKALLGILLSLARGGRA